MSFSFSCWTFYFLEIKFFFRTRTVTTKQMIGKYRKKYNQRNKILNRLNTTNRNRIRERTNQEKIKIKLSNLFFHFYMNIWFNSFVTIVIYINTFLILFIAIADSCLGKFLYHIWICVVGVVVSMFLTDF